MAAVLFCACKHDAPIQMPEGTAAPPCAADGRKACEEACEQADGAACLAASIANFEQRRFDMMMTYEQRACDLGVAEGCYDYATNFTSGKRADAARVIEYDRKACDGRHPDGCTRLGESLMRAEAEGGFESAADALSALDASCELGSMRGCAMAADVRLLGLGTNTDEAVARAGYAGACADGYEDACHNVEHAADELRLSLPLEVLFEPVFTGGPQLVLQDEVTPQKVDGRVRFCMDVDGSVPATVEMAKSTGIPDLDAAFLEIVAGWRFRARAKAVDRRVCAGFDVRVYLAGRR